MADIIDEHGNPIQLTDEQGQQVRLTDEHGVPMHLTGVAQPMTAVGKDDALGGGQAVMGGGDVGGDKHQLGKTGSSSGSGSSSSEENDNREGVRRRKKKGLMQKIKEKLPGHKNKDEQEQVLPEKVYTATTKVTVTTPAGPIGEPKPEHVHVEHREEEHEKKGLMDKIKDKLPGHH
uniref:late embryogenesis abundant protein-like n=1 Tax=Erigeron canadensis TaxID=72917 RepID=UPI001CB9086E|nr:late embryogenesis abundant protein-like [Erigeron canadensis]